jgi:hypothetical protein
LKGINVAGKFPCPYCKGQYSWVEPVLDDGSGPTYTCGFCDEGMIEIGGEKHKEIKRNNPPKDIMWECITELSYALDQVIDALEKLPADGWSDGPHLLQVCKKAREYHYDPQ